MKTKLIAGASIALALAVAAPTAQAAPSLSISEARTKMRHLIVRKTTGGVERWTISITDCVRQSTSKIRCHVSFTDNDGQHWSGNAWSKLKPSDPSIVVSNYDVWS